MKGLTSVTSKTQGNDYNSDIRVIENERPSSSAWQSEGFVNPRSWVRIPPRACTNPVSFSDHASLLIGTASCVIGTDKGSLEVFREYLQKTRRPWTIKEHYNYAKRFGQMLETRHASELLALSNKNRIHAMSALAALSKFQGRYELWKSIKQEYDLKWTCDNDL